MLDRAEARLHNGIIPLVPWLGATARSWPGVMSGTGTSVQDTDYLPTRGDIVKFLDFDGPRARVEKLEK